MAAVAGGSRSSISRTISLFRSSFNLIRNFTASPTTASSSSPPSSTSTSASATNKPKKKKKKNLFEVAQFLPNWGIGYKMAKSHWKGVSYEITKINLYKDGRHGKAWGIVHKDGVPPADAPKKISGVHKRCWRYIPEPKKPAETKPIPEPKKPAETKPGPEVQA